VRSVAKASGHSLAFAYGASGQRTQKQVGDPALDPTAYREHYIRDAQGNIMATYRYTNTGAASLKLNERPVYGSSRLGSLRTEVELHTLPSFDPVTANPVQMVDLNYELTDHLGNVCAVVTGRLLDGNGGGTAKQAELVNAQGYEPFGSLLPGRNYSSGLYRFGFNGKEKDDEIHGATGTSYDFGARMYDSRVSRFLSRDRLSDKFPFYSPYLFAGNDPISSIDFNGDHKWRVTYQEGAAANAGTAQLVLVEVDDLPDQVLSARNNVMGAPVTDPDTPDGWRAPNASEAGQIAQIKANYTVVGEVGTSNGQTNTVLNFTDGTPAPGMVANAPATAAAEGVVNTFNFNFTDPSQTPATTWLYASITPGTPPFIPGAAQGGMELAVQNGVNLARARAAAAGGTATNLDVATMQGSVLGTPGALGSGISNSARLFNQASFGGLTCTGCAAPVVVPGLMTPVGAIPPLARAGLPAQSSDVNFQLNFRIDVPRTLTRVGGGAQSAPAPIPQ
jgi:RHS repeat-associated protein